MIFYNHICVGCLGICQTYLITEALDRSSCYWNTFSMHATQKRIFDVSAKKITVQKFIVFIFDVLNILGVCSASNSTNSKLRVRLNVLALRRGSL